MQEITCFKAYDVRGRVPDQLNEEIARRIGRAYAEVIKPRQVVVGHDIRLTSEAIKAAVTQGLLEQGVDVYDIGLCGTEGIYFATSHAGMDGGIAVTASHNPKDYNGMKFVREESRPISADTGLLDIRQLAEQDNFQSAAQPGQLHTLDTTQAYVEHLLSYVDVATLKPLKIVVDAGNGGAGAVIDRLETRLPFEFIKLHHEPDGNFPLNTDKDAWGGTVKVTPLFEGVIPNLDVEVPITVKLNPSGVSSVQATFLENSDSISLGFDFTYRAVWQWGLSYTSYFGGTEHEDDYYNVNDDRDYIGFTLKYSF